MAEPVLFSFVQNHDPYIPRENEKKSKKQEKRKKNFLPLLLNLFEPIFWTFLYQTVMNFYFTFTLLSIEVWIFTNETNEASRGRNRGGDLLSAASKIILFFLESDFLFFIKEKIILSFFQDLSKYFSVDFDFLSLSKEKFLNCFVDWKKRDSLNEIVEKIVEVFSLFQPPCLDKPKQRSA